MDNYTLTMLSTLVFLVIFVLVVNRLTREDSQTQGANPNDHAPCHVSALSPSALVIRWP